MPRSPSFWYDTSTRAARVKAVLLLTLSVLYLAGEKLRRLTARPYHAKIPVICIGNLVAGGSGKTPVAQAVMDIVRDNKLAATPVFLSRGYGGRLAGPLQVDPARHTYNETGDEPLLLARAAPAFISRDRKAGAQTAENFPADLIIMDDGLQNPSLHKTLRLVVIDGQSGFGNGWPLPAGPLRQNLKTGLKSADAFILIGEDRHGMRKNLPPGKPVFTAHLAVPSSWNADKTKSYVAFCGLGRPKKFRTTIAEQQLNLAQFHEFPDHHPYRASDLSALETEAARLDANLLTTEKDALRFPANYTWKKPPVILPVQIAWDDEGAFKNFLREKLGTASP